MAASKQEISEWFDSGVRQQATHMIVVCDTFDCEDYPVYVEKGKDPHDVAKEYDNKDMQRIMEVYSLAKRQTQAAAAGRTSRLELGLAP